MTGQPVILPDQSQERFARRHIDGNTTTNFTLDNSGHMQEYSVCCETEVVPGLVFNTSTGLCFRLISRRAGEGRSCAYSPRAFSRRSVARDGSEDVQLDGLSLRCGECGHG